MEVNLPETQVWITLGHTSSKGVKETRPTTGLAKRYGVLLTHLTMRRAQIELVGELSTDSFLPALRRFISRRGHIKVLSSDNGIPTSWLLTMNSNYVLSSWINQNFITSVTTVI